jgi:hypothetical protein
MASQKRMPFAARLANILRVKTLLGNAFNGCCQAALCWSGEPTVLKANCDWHRMPQARCRIPKNCLSI